MRVVMTLLFFVSLLVSCGSTVKENVQVGPAVTPVVFDVAVPPAPANNKEQDFSNYPLMLEPNKLVSMTSSDSVESFVENIQSIAMYVALYDTKISLALGNCEIGVSDSSEGFSTIHQGDHNTCAIMLLRNQDQTGEVFGQFAPTPQGDFIVAATTDFIGDSSYPVIVVPEGTYDLWYLVRVFAHEGWHMTRIKDKKDGCNNTLDTECVLGEEVLAYKLQFQILEKQYGQDFQVKNMLLDGSNDFEVRALESENELYIKNKEGILKEYLAGINYTQE